MENNEKINVRGAINSLEVGAPPLELPRDDYPQSSVRSTASTVAADTGKKFTVNLDADNSRVIVTRLS